MNRNWKATLGSVADAIRQGRRRWRRSAAVWIALAIVGAQAVVQLVETAPAAAVPGLEKRTSARSGDNTVPVKTATARCPAGKRVIGGGGWVDDDGTGKVMLTQLEPVHAGHGDSYVVTAQAPRIGFGGTWWLEAYAICASSLPGLRIVSGAGDFDSSTFKATAAACLGGTRVIGTGARVFNPGREVGLQLSRASGPLDIARATAREDADGYLGNWTVISYAICADPVQDARAVGNVDNSVGALVDCPPGTLVHAAGGGGALTDPGPVFLQVLYPFNNLRRVQMYMTARPPAGGVVAQAICAP